MQDDDAAPTMRKSVFAQQRTFLFCSQMQVVRSKVELIVLERVFIQLGSKTSNIKGPLPPTTHSSRKNVIVAIIVNLRMISCKPWSRML